MFLYQRLLALSRLHRSKFLRPLFFNKTSLNVNFLIIYRRRSRGGGGRGRGVSMDKAANYFEMACAPSPMAPLIILSVPRLPPQPHPPPRRSRRSVLGGGGGAGQHGQGRHFPHGPSNNPVSITDSGSTPPPSPKY